MKNMYKFFGVIAVIAIIGFSMAACGGDSTETVTLTANAQGEITISYSGGEEMTVTIETNLPSPNNKFTFKKSGDSKTITGLIEGQKVNVTISFPGKYSNIDKSSDGSTVWIQTYKN